MEDTIIVGISGGSASGKTTIVNTIENHFKEDIEIICHDYYYKSHDLPFCEREKLNYDHPKAFETDLMVSDLIKLKNKEEIYRPEYDYNIHNRSDKLILVNPKKLLIVEGILILENKKLRDLMDLKVFIDTDADERLMRRIERDVKYRGRSVESVLKQYRETVKPMHDKFVEPSKKYADLIIPRGGGNRKAINILINHLEDIMRS